jgi:transcription elongation factor Elf1
MPARLPKIEPCIECPYPTNYTVNTLSVNGAKEKFAVHCRECGDSWIEEVNINNEY